MKIKFPNNIDLNHGLFNIELNQYCTYPVKFGLNGIIRKCHKEDDILVIDEFELESMEWINK